LAGTPGGEPVLDDDLGQARHGSPLLAGDFAEFEGDTGGEVDVNCFAGNGAAGTTNGAGHISHFSFLQIFGRFSRLLYSL